MPFSAVPPTGCSGRDQFLISEYLAERVVVFEVLGTLSPEQLAKIYRSVDFSINSSRSEGFGFTVAESLACGTPAIFGDFGATREFKTPNGTDVRRASVESRLP